MAKRKSTTKAPSSDIAESDSDNSDGGSSSSSTPSLINVEFDFFPPSLDVDLIALKRLLRSLLHSDSDLFNLHEIAEVVLERCEKDGVGSCIKVDGEESDPFSFLSVVGLDELKAIPAGKTLIAHLIKQSSKNKPLHALLSTVLAAPSTTTTTTPTPRIGLLISERLINMPVQTQPPLYRMLGEEIAAASAKGNTSYAFTHYLLLSKLYVAPTFSVQSGNASSKNKKKKANKAKATKAAGAGADDMQVDGEDALLLNDGGPLPFHPEDSLLARHALHQITFPFLSAPPRKADDPLEFGLDQRGGMMLFEAGKWAEIVKSLETGCV
ncbi:p21-C-terminal region-binding protein-domain-containing protein [Mrakia frigida]|uniref:protein-transporting protein BCP1 n=1 Tax=Mrakia frigida TaxID=29902 RepID=UPI003FCC1214